MEAHSILISPDAQYGQALTIILTESELDELHLYLAEIELNYPGMPKVAKDLRMELWYMLLELHEFNAYLKAGDEQ